MVPEAHGCEAVGSYEFRPPPSSYHLPMPDDPSTREVARSDLQLLQEKILRFAAEREWQQFHDCLAAAVWLAGQSLPHCYLGAARAFAPASSTQMQAL